jgi:catechol 1,2-dioxygenase
MSSINRREFIAFTLIAGVGICSGCLLGCSASAAATTCVTTDDILGPYYRAGAPLRNNLRIPGDSGTPLRVYGKVLSSTDCISPISNANLEVWQCDAQAKYDNSTSEFRYRGRLITDEKGQYELKTIKPGWYLNGDNYRPSHIHFRLVANDHKGLVTQLYFSGDPYIESDPFASNAKAKMRILPVDLEEETSYGVNFNIVLQRS